MKTGPERSWLMMVRLLVPGILLILQCGCVSPGPENKACRPWAMSDELELGYQQQRWMWWGWFYGNSPGFENQRTEEWLRYH